MSKAFLRLAARDFALDADLVLALDPDVVPALPRGVVVPRRGDVRLGRVQNASVKP